jgi:hypothetical protein
MSAPYGIIFDEPPQVYHANDAWSNSKLKLFRRYPVAAQRRYITKVTKPEKPSDPDAASVAGSAWHALLFEGEAAYQARFAIAPFDNFRTDAAKAWKAKAALDGIQVIGSEASERVDQMVKATRAHPEAMILLSAGRPEVTFRKHLGRFDVQCRPDWWNPKGGIGLGAETIGAYFVDGKSTVSLCPEDYWTNFKMQFQKFGYYYQAALYRELIAEIEPLHGAQIRPAMFYIAQENDEPYQCQVFQPDEEAYATAVTELRADLRALAKCYETGVWPGAPVGVQMLYLQHGFQERRLAAAEQKELTQ